MGTGSMSDLIEEELAKAPPLNDWQISKLKYIFSDKYSRPIRQDISKMGNLYIVLFANGVAKVGMSTNVSSRIASYKQPYAYEIVDHWISPSIPEEILRQVETSLLKKCEEIATRVGQSECFKYASLHTMTEVGKQIVNSYRID